MQKTYIYARDQFGSEHSVDPKNRWKDMFWERNDLEGFAGCVGGGGMV